MEPEQNYSAKHIIAACVVAAVAGAVFGGLVKLLNLDLDSAVEVTGSALVALGALWLSLVMLKKRKKQ
ncbi:MAG: hypothetical protein LBO20_04865 [Bifidobacteriaceae bacterium]|jgi:hypothetical protein|nr:hypothetical protein [Bifidobacteriaceae bacterium]